MRHIKLLVESRDAVFRAGVTITWWVAAGLPAKFVNLMTCRRVGLLE
jgi:hypothetical protein